MDSSPADSAARDSALDSMADSALPDAGDAGDAGGPVDSGVGVDASGPTFASRVTGIIEGTSITLPIVDGSGAPLLLTTSAAFDHDSAAGESLIASDGPGRRVSASFTTTEATFGTATAWVDGSGATITPDLLFAGALGTGPEVLIGIFGTNARAYDFTANEFGAVVPLVQTGGTPFTPISATTVNVIGTGASIVALTAASPNIFVFNVGTALFEPVPTAPVICGGGAAIVAEHILGALIPGLMPPGGADSVILIDGSNAHVLQTLDPFCFSDAFPLVDEDGAPVIPEQAYGWDYDGDSDDDVILIDTVVVP